MKIDDLLFNIFDYVSDNKNKVMKYFKDLKERKKDNDTLNSNIDSYEVLYGQYKNEIKEREIYTLEYLTKLLNSNNLALLGDSLKGKTLLIKYLIKHFIEEGEQLIVIDKFNEYKNLVKKLNGDIYKIDDYYKINYDSNLICIDISDVSVPVNIDKLQSFMLNVYKNYFSKSDRDKKIIIDNIGRILKSNPEAMDMLAGFIDYGNKKDVNFILSFDNIRDLIVYEEGMNLLKQIDYKLFFKIKSEDGLFDVLNFNLDSIKIVNNLELGEAYLLNGKIESFDYVEISYTDSEYIFLETDIKSIKEVSIKNIIDNLNNNSNHNMIVIGTENTGKTVLSKALALEFKSKGERVIILDTKGKYKLFADTLGVQYIDDLNKLKGSYLHGDLIIINMNNKNNEYIEVALESIKKTVTIFNNQKKRIIIDNIDKLINSNNKDNILNILESIIKDSKKYDISVITTLNDVNLLEDKRLLKMIINFSLAFILKQKSIYNQTLINYLPIPQPLLRYMNLDPYLSNKKVGLMISEGGSYQYIPIKINEENQIVLL